MTSRSRRSSRRRSSRRRRECLVLTAALAAPTVS
jgi:hypothetical protein